MNNSTKLISYSLAGVVLGIVTAFLGLIISGGGHGPFAEVSPIIIKVALAFSALSLFVLALSLVVSLFEKVLPSQSSATTEAPNYNWRCPKCDDVVKANSSQCPSCGHQL